MQSAWLDSAIAWISAHPVAAGGLIAGIAFCDALAVVGIVVPALPLLFAVGALIGLGHVNGPYAIACAAFGALAGDGLSYWAGHRFGPRMRERWPFRRYPQLLERGEQLFRCHGTKAVLIARYVGAVRPFVPATAGMLRMPMRRYLPMSAFAAVTWAASFLAPGWLFGASYDAVAAVADRLALVLLALLAAVALAWAVVLYTWRWFAQHADALLARALAWTQRHPRLGRYAAPLLDPNRPGSAALAILAVALLVVGWLWFGLLAAQLLGTPPFALDREAYALMQSLRNPLADQLLAPLAALGHPRVLLPPTAVALLWLCWRRRWMAAAHWLAALAFGLALATMLESLVSMPKPADAPIGFRFPAIPVTMTAVALGFFAVLIARELPGRRRAWPYLVAGIAAMLVGFARVYLGLHWLSDVVGGLLFAGAWMLALGIAYRRHVSRSFWMRPLAWLFYGTFVAAALWHAPRARAVLLARAMPATPALPIAAADWRDHGWQRLPAQRASAAAVVRDARVDDVQMPAVQMLDVQVLGPLPPLQARLAAQGWVAQAQAGWVDVLGLLDPDTPPARQPVLPATLGAQAESLLLRRAHPGREDRIDVLRLWPAPAREASGVPLWLGETQTLRFLRPRGWFGIWRPAAPDAGARARLRAALQGMAVEESARDDAPQCRVLRIDTTRASADQAQ